MGDDVVRLSALPQPARVGSGFKAVAPDTGEWQFATEGTLIYENEKVYWFKGDTAGVLGQQLHTFQTVHLVEDIIGRKLNAWELRLLTSKPGVRAPHSEDMFPANRRITIVSKLGIDPSPRHYLPTKFQVTAYLVSTRAANLAGYDQGQLIGTDALYDTDGNQLELVQIKRSDEAGLGAPLIDPIDLWGIAKILRIGMKLLLRKLTEAAERKLVGKLGAMAGKDAKFAFWKAGMIAPRKFTAEETKALTAQIENRMKQLGIPQENIGIRGIPGESGKAFNALGDERGANLRTVGISVHGNVEQPWAGFPEWNAASVNTRIDTVIAHEWMEFNELTHWETVEVVTETKLAITNEARGLLTAMQRRGRGFEALLKGERPK